MACSCSWWSAMNAAVEMEENKYPDRKVVPAAMLYYRVHDPIVEGEETENEEQIQEKSWRACG